VRTFADRASDQIVLRDETLNILLAGRDTVSFRFSGLVNWLTPGVQTANTITYAAYLLAEHPKVLERLRKEVLETVGETRRPTYDDVKNMKYMRAVINGRTFSSSFHNTLGLKDCRNPSIVPRSVSDNQSLSSPRFTNRS
jgi:hypothetical protein